MNPQHFAIESVVVSETHIIVTAKGGLRFGVPLSQYPRLEKATREERENWKLVDAGCGLSWPELWTPSSRGALNVMVLSWDRLCREAQQRLRTLKWEFGALDEATKEVVALWRMEEDLINGGFQEFFTNWGSETLDYALRALHGVGATKSHTLLDGMRDYVRAFESSDNHYTVDEILEKLTVRQHDELGKLSTKLCADPDQLWRLGVLHYGELLNTSES
jgi:hypothetical protein